jgi:hypothetical protein
VEVEPSFLQDVLAGRWRIGGPDCHSLSGGGGLFAVLNEADKPFEFCKIEILLRARAELPFSVTIKAQDETISTVSEVSSDWQAICVIFERLISISPGEKLKVEFLLEGDSCVLDLRSVVFSPPNADSKQIRVLEPPQTFSVGDGKAIEIARLAPLIACGPLEGPYKFSPSRVFWKIGRECAFLLYAKRESSGCLLCYHHVRSGHRATFEINGHRIFADLRKGSGEVHLQAPIRKGKNIIKVDSNVFSEDPRQRKLFILFEDGAKLLGELERHYEQGEIISLARGGFPQRFMGEGWHEPDGTGCWTSERASLFLSTTVAGDAVLRLDVQSLRI